MVERIPVLASPKRKPSSACDSGTGWLTATLLVTVLCCSCNAKASDQPTAGQKSLLPPVACSRCWHPALKTSWQWQLHGTVNQSFEVTMYDIDMFENSSDVVKSLHSAGRIVICYLDAGSWENWRPDASKFPDSVKGKPLVGFPDEQWLDIRQVSILGPILQARMDLCKSKGFDGVEFDNVDGSSNDTGFPLTARDQLTFNTWLANQAHSRGLSLALKNDLDQVPTLLPYFDWELNEQCFEYQECEKLLLFIHAGKPVMNVEYHLNPSQFCPQANKMNFNSLKKHLGLEAYRVACR